MQRYIIELARRVILVGLSLVGIWFIFTPNTEELVVVELVDFQHSFENYPYFKSKELTLEKFKADALKDRSLLVSSQDWQRFFEGVENGERGFGLQQISSHSGVNFLFRKDQLPDYSADWPRYLYVGLQDQWVSLRTENAAEVRGIDRRIKYPMQSAGLVMLVVGWVLYAIIPRHKAKENQLYYHQWASVIIPDLLGTVGACFFLALSILIICENEPGYTPLTVSGSWLVITFVFWGMATIFLSMLFVAQKYANLLLEVTAFGLIIDKSRKRTKLSWYDVQSCELYTGGGAGIVGSLLILFSNNPATIGQGLLVLANQEHGIKLTLKDGSHLRIMRNHLTGFDRLVTSLKREKVKGSQQLEI